MLNPEYISFDPGPHTYTDTRTGQIVPSVTQILQVLGGYEGVDRAVLQYAGQRGSAIHAACELYNQDDLDYDGLDPMLRRYVDGWIQFRKDTGFKPEISEAITYNPDYGYAGTIDCLGKMPDQNNVLIDIKTQSVPSPLKWGLQLAGYMESFAVNERPQSQAVVHLRGDGRYSYYKLSDYRYWKRFRACLEVYNIKKEMEQEGI